MNGHHLIDWLGYYAVWFRDGTKGSHPLA
ncbi:uncharacterized protein METZ01_LOCUS280153, partial [marine metagenome]